MKAESPVRKTFRFGKREIPYSLVREKRKRMRILVEPDLSVHVAVPKGAKDRDIDDLLRKKARWIVQKVDKTA